jgi:hypothetical protein
MTQLASWLFGPSIRGYYHQGTKILYSQSTLEGMTHSMIYNDSYHPSNL